MAFPHGAASSISSHKVHLLLNAPGVTAPQLLSWLSGTGQGPRSAGGQQDWSSPQGGWEVPTGCRGPPPWWARLGRARGCAGQGCGEVETGTAAAALEQGPTAPGLWAGTAQGHSGLLAAAGPGAHPGASGEACEAPTPAGWLSCCHTAAAQKSLLPHFLLSQFPRRCRGPVSMIPFPPSQPSPSASHTLGGERLFLQTRG